MNLVLGYGNPLREDDGVGWRTAELILAERWPHTAVRQLHQLVPEAALWLSEVDVAVLIDTAMSTTIPPGTITCQRLEPEPSIPTPSAFSHHLTPERVLGMAQALYGHAPRAYLLTVTGASFGFSETLSTAVEKAVPQLITHTAQLLALQPEPPA